MNSQIHLVNMKNKLLLSIKFVTLSAFSDVNFRQSPNSGSAFIFTYVHQLEQLIRLKQSFAVFLFITLYLLFLLNCKE